jgi:hypothetical protein
MDTDKLIIPLKISLLIFMAVNLQKKGDRL